MGARGCPLRWHASWRRERGPDRTADPSRTQRGGDTQPTETTASSYSLLKPVPVACRVRSRRGDPSTQASCQRSVSRARTPAVVQTCWDTSMSRFLVVAILFYRNTLSNMMLHSCRFVPSCSEYALQAVRRYGTVRGLWRTVTRLLRCHPFSRGGVDSIN